MIAGIIFPEVVARIFALNSADVSLIQNAAEYIAPVLIGSLPIILYEILGAETCHKSGVSDTEASRRLPEIRPY